MSAWDWWPFVAGFCSSFLCVGALAAAWWWLEGRYRFEPRRPTPGLRAGFVSVDELRSADGAAVFEPRALVVRLPRPPYDWAAEPPEEVETVA